LDFAGHHQTRSEDCCERKKIDGSFGFEDFFQLTVLVPIIKVASMSIKRMKMSKIVQKKPPVTEILSEVDEKKN
jgi:hypothetical protein